jgi:hypothetical protein
MKAAFSKSPFDRRKALRLALISTPLLGARQDCRSYRKGEFHRFKYVVRRAV